MSDFSYQHHQTFLLDSPHTLILPQQVEKMSNSASYSLYYHTHDAIPETTTTESRTNESSSSLDSARKATAGEGQMNHSSSVVSELHAAVGVSKPQGPIEKKSKYGSCLTSVQSKYAKGSKSWKQKKPSGGGLKLIEGKKPKADEKKEREECDEPPVGYIHVRARRGQATDSHSLAERVRREKISERMKLLQALVPGCDKVVGKASMLDEIIKYVQSLQNQVELASLNPILYNFGGDFEGHSHQQEKLGSMPQYSQLVPPVHHQASPFQPKDWEGTTRSHPVMDMSAPFLMHGQGPIAFAQDIGRFLLQVGEQRRGVFN